MSWLWFESDRRAGIWLGRLMRVVAALALAVTAACGSIDDSGPADTAPPPAAAPEDESAASTAATSVSEMPDASASEVSVPTASAPDVSVPSASTPDTSAPAGSVPEAAAPEVSVPDASVPDASVPDASVPEASTPDTSAPEVSAPDMSAPDMSAPEVSVPDASAPDASAPEAAVPEAAVPSVSLPLAPERDGGYNRDDWGPHNSGLCRGAAGSPDPYTGTPIDTCNVDHVVALHEAHQSGGWAWSAGQKQRFSQAPDNHVASRACVNQSKGGDDISEWSDADIARSSACGGGYRVTTAGRCFLARTTVAVKSEWGLAVDQAEAEALGATLAGCGDQALEFSTGSQATTSTNPPPTTAATTDECVIGNRTAADYDAVSGIGEVLSVRLVEAQPFASRSELEAVRGIGPARSQAVWSHFCGQ